MKIRLAVFSSIAIVSLLSSACSKDQTTTAKPEPQQVAQQPSQTGDHHAPAGAKPGSHDDWCAEHSVPESQCTRCNPSLAAAFKATGDWCAEHGLPESQCLKCNPNLKIVRPPKEN